MGALEDYFNEIAANETARNMALTAGLGLTSGPLQNAALLAYAGNLNSALASDLKKNFPNNYTPEKVAEDLKFQGQTFGSVVPGTIGDVSRMALGATIRDMYNAPRINYPEGYTPPSIPNIESVPYSEDAQFRYAEPTAQELPQSAIPGLPLRRYQAPPPPMEQGPPAPMAPDWVPPVGAPEQYPPEALAAMTPQEQAAAQAGYTPPKVLPVLNMIDEARVNSPVKAVVLPAAKRIATTPAVDTAYEEMLKLAPAEYRPMFKALREKSQMDKAQRQDALNQMASEVENQRQRRLDQIEKAVNNLPEQAHQYGAIRYNVNREVAMANRKADLAAAELAVQGMDRAAAADHLKNAKDEIDVKYKDAIKSFEQTEEAKQAIARKDKLSEKVIKQQNLIEQIDKMQEYMANGDIEKARQLGASQVAQTMNSLISDNAIQLSEMLIKFPSLLTQDMKNELAGKGIFAPSSIIRGLWNAPESESYLKKAGDYFQGDKKTAIGIIKAYTSANPASFIQTAIDAANANGTALNKYMNENVVKPTSPDFAKWTDFPLIDDSKMRQGLARPPQAEAQQAAPAVQPGQRKSKSGISFTILP
ncbi:hypothetical protein UFOVP917_42 [uncultured Caudovirales phage]|uniref:Uncharacterized protein n=1 Tax=uncultured Caudovirales phage TaxID=2100421 RepID=A0A6J5LNI6_9CAUD|nr:hypothetical protein UFOVP297_20 [uncultured Caudovirales phage]CAB4171321.1 hypothetical protein UFOVP917_42 [uncultured Caudovirales phage]CAB4183170.1 hypothetical protein UFOVP1094_44 [uncultured Caudovirales phage]CAB4200543.1 hypothetical protein UFOVP1342_44 [uncultured Caudovirales phage]CAB4213407.1 hypothetical protein UFOVP1450_14 [uncultured Caudovirales phage]